MSVSVIELLHLQIRDLENDLNTEAKRHSETMNNAIRHERRAKELELQTEEDQKNMKRLQEMVEKLSNKVKLYKRKVEEAVSDFVSISCRQIYVLSIKIPPEGRQKEAYNEEIPY